MTREGQKEEMKETRSERRKIRLTIRGVQSGFGEEEITEITTIADYFHKDGVHYLFYSEITEEGYTVKNRLTVAPDTVELKKPGREIPFSGSGPVIRKIVGTIPRRVCFCWCQTQKDWKCARTGTGLRCGWNIRFICRGCGCPTIG